MQSQYITSPEAELRSTSWPQKDKKKTIELLVLGMGSPKTSLRGVYWAAG